MNTAFPRWVDLCTTGLRYQNGSRSLMAHFLGVVMKFWSRVFALCLLTSLTATSANAQAVVTGLVLNEVLKGFTTRIQNIVAQAGDEARSTALAAAGEVNVLVNNLSFVYKDALLTTIKETDRALTSQLQQVDSVLTKLEGNLKQDVTDVLKQVQQITLTIPFTRKEPQLTSQSPRIVSVASDEVVLKLSGIFYYAKESGFVPYATVNGKKVESAGGTNELLFKLKRDDLSGVPDKMVINNLQVIVPYRPDCWYCFFGKKEATYNLLLGVLPASAGSIEISATHPVAMSEVKDVTSGVLGMSSQDCCDRKGDVCDSPIPSGWTYVQGSAEMINLNQIGGSRKYHDWDEKGPRIGTAVCWYVETYQHNHGTDGNVSFQIKYKLQRNFDQDHNTRLAKFDLKWGDSRVVPLPDRAGNWIASYTLFDKNRTYETSAAGKIEPGYVEISRPSSGALQIRVAPPPDF